MHRRSPSSSPSQPLLARPSHGTAPTARTRPRRRHLALVALVALATLALAASRRQSSRPRDTDNSPGPSPLSSLRAHVPARIIKDTASRLLSHAFRPSSPPLTLPAPSPPVLLAPLARPKRVSYAEPWVYAADPATLPPCERILLFTFMPWWGFASEYILYARAAAAAKKLNYTFLEDDRNWNYGRLSNYFVPRKLSCVPPPDWTDPGLAVPFSPAALRTTSPSALPKRLTYSRLTLSTIDDWTRETYLSSPQTQAALVALRESDRKHRDERDRAVLGEGESLDEAFGEVFRDQSEWVRANWRVAREVARGVRRVRKGVGLDRPRWEASAPEDEKERGRGPVVAVHVRLGDKASEYEHDAEEMGIANTFGNLTVYVEAAHDAYRRLVPSSYPPLSPSPSPSVERFSPYAPPTLLVITAEPDIPLRLRRDVALADPWDIVQSPAVEVRAEGEGVERLREEGPEAGAAGRSKAYAAGVAAGGASGSDKDKMVKVVVSPNNNNNNKKKPAAARRLTRTRTRRAAPATLTLDVGYTQQAFNALPLLERVAHTQAFVRDLTVLVNEADAAVVSGASNVGRLAMLIAGEDAVMGPRDPSTGKPLGGRIRSVDAHWYPTAYSSAVYRKVEDVEDLENAAFVPEEQHRAEVEALERQRLEEEQQQRRGRKRRRGGGRKKRT